MESSNLTVNELIEATKEELIRNGYKDLALIGIERVWRNLEEYLATRNLDHFSIDVGLKFLEDRYHFSATQKTSSSNNARLMAINLLEDFQPIKQYLSGEKANNINFHHSLKKSSIDLSISEKALDSQEERLNQTKYI